MGTEFEFKGVIKDISKTLDSNWIISLSVPKYIKEHLQPIEKAFDELKDKDIRITLKAWREKRSLDANSYFHLLIGKIAEKMNISAEQCKINMVLDYGSVMRDEQGSKVGIKLPSSVDVSKVYKYAKQFDTRQENGKEFNCYIIYEQTHNYDTAQMATLIKGVCNECKDLGIETITPAEREKLLSLWENYKG